MNPIHGGIKEAGGNHLKREKKLRETLEKLSTHDLNDIVDTLKPEDIIEFARGAKLSVLAKVLMRKLRLITIAKSCSRI